MTRGRRGSIYLLALSAACLVTLVSAGIAAADREKIRLTAAGQAAARAAVLTPADLGSAGGWTGGPKKPSLSPAPLCANYRPKQSDLVLVGAAESVWRQSGLEYDSVAQVLRTPEMVRLDWQRTVVAPQVLPCLRAGMSKQLPSSERLVSFSLIPFPQLSTYTRAFRAVVDVKTSVTTVRVLVDLVLVGRGRTEITLTTTAPFVAQSSVAASEVRLARRLVSRIRA